MKTKQEIESLLMTAQLTGHNVYAHNGPGFCTRVLGVKEHGEYGLLIQNGVGQWIRVCETMEFDAR